MKHDVCKKSLMVFLQEKPWSQFRKLDLINDIVKSFSFSFFIFSQKAFIKNSIFVQISSFLSLR